MGNAKSRAKEKTIRVKVAESKESEVNNDWCKWENINADINVKYENMPYKQEVFKYDSDFFKDIKLKSQAMIFEEIVNILLHGTLTENDTSLQLKILQVLILFLNPILIETEYKRFDINTIGYNIIDLCTVFLPNQYEKSKLFLLNLKKLSVNTFQRFLLNECSIFKEMNIANDIVSVISDYVSQISTIFEYAYPNDGLNQYPKSFHHGPYYCFVKSIFICSDFISIEYDEHGDVNDAGRIQGPNQSKIYCDKFCKRVSYQSNFEYDLDKRCQGRLIYNCSFNEYKDDLKEIHFQFGSWGYSNVSLFEKSNRKQNMIVDELAKCFLN